MAQATYQDYIKAIASRIPAERIYTDALRRLAYGTDAGFYRLEPSVVVRALSEEDMSCCLREATARKLPR